MSKNLWSDLTNAAMRPEEASGPKTWNADDVEGSKCLIMNPSLPVEGFENIYLNVLPYLLAQIAPVINILSSQTASLTQQALDTKQNLPLVSALS
jgi:hypothetical protein